MRSGTHTRPSFIVASSGVQETVHTYPRTTEAMGPVRRLGHAAGLQRIAINLQRLPPGTRSSLPHAESDAEEFIYVLYGEVDAWIDGHLYRMSEGDFAAFPAGTGIAHCFINNSHQEVRLLVGGEPRKSGNQVVYPLHGFRKFDMPSGAWWDDAPVRKLGPHDALPRVDLS